MKESTKTAIVKGVKTSIPYATVMVVTIPMYIASNIVIGKFGDKIYEFIEDKLN